jgi:CCR4-NOT transcription complex subunit 2
MTEDERWGMAGFNAILEARRQIEIGGEVDDTMPPQYRNAMVVMGQDLNALGMDLENPEPLHPSFSVFPSRNPSSSMFDYKDHHPVPAFTVPPAYTVNNVPPMHARMGAFSDGNLNIHICKVNANFEIRNAIADLLPDAT